MTPEPGQRKTEFVVGSSLTNRVNSVMGSSIGPQEFEKLSRPTRQVIGQLVHERDILRGKLAAEIRARRKAEAASGIDHLTKIMNADALKQRLDEILDLRSDTNPYRKHATYPVTSVVMIDLNDFGIINKRYSHAAGDLVLRRFAKQIRYDERFPDDEDRLYKNDIFGRRGGDEFVIVMREATKEEATKKVERMLQKIIANPVIFYPDYPDKKRQHHIPISFAYGVEEMQPGDTRQSLEYRLDEQLKRHKIEIKAKLKGEGRLLEDGEVLVEDIIAPKILRILAQIGPDISSKSSIGGSRVSER